jgi:O-methyltransferase
MTSSPRWPDRLDWLLKRLDHFVQRFGLSIRRTEYDLRLVDAGVHRIVRSVNSFTMTDPLAIVGLVDSVDYLENAGVGGAFVECGVWRGGSAMAAALRMRESAFGKREIWLYDTYEGMTNPTRDDIRARDGLNAAERFNEARRTRPKDRTDWFWAEASLEDVSANLAGTGYPSELVRFVKGPVEETIPGTAPEKIALLRLDTDWYESTRHELEHLFPRLQPGGILIVDDYHYWRGSRKAVDEYFQMKHMTPLFSRIGSNGAVVARFA